MHATLDRAGHTKGSPFSPLPCRFTRPDERRHDARPQTSPLPVDLCVGLGAWVALQERQGFLIARRYLPPLEVLELRVVPAHRSLLHHGKFLICMLNHRHPVRQQGSPEKAVGTSPK